MSMQSRQNNIKRQLSSNGSTEDLKPSYKKSKKAESICRQLRELGAKPFETDMKGWTKIGQGAFGVVYSKGNKALKVINLEAKNIKPDELMTEIKILKKISNLDCVVNMTKFYIDESCHHLYIEMELSTVGDMMVLGEEKIVFASLIPFFLPLKPL